MDFFREQLANLETRIEQLEQQPLLIYSKAEKGIEICKEILDTMRLRVLKKGFKGVEMECKFFKSIKPQVVRYIIHYLNLVYVERHKPFSRGEQGDFYIAQIGELRNYFIEHREFYEYYIRGLAYRDIEFFSRRAVSTEIEFTSIASIIDIEFSTSHDMILANILGNIRTIEYLQKRIGEGLAEIPFANKPQGNYATLKWTGSKVDLVELVYALHSCGMINNGQAEIKELAEGMEILFSKKLGDYYRTFLEIRTRKIQPTKFLDYLKRSLENRIVEADG